jgi:hypothetical protein
VRSGGHIREPAAAPIQRRGAGRAAAARSAPEPRTHPRGGRAGDPGRRATFSPSRKAVSRSCRRSPMRADWSARTQRCSVSSRRNSESADLPGGGGGRAAGQHLPLPCQGSIHLAGVGGAVRPRGRRRVDHHNPRRAHAGADGTGRARRRSRRGRTACPTGCAACGQFCRARSTPRNRRCPRGVRVLLRSRVRHGVEAAPDGAKQRRYELGLGARTCRSLRARNSRFRSVMPA